MIEGLLGVEGKSRFDPINDWYKNLVYEVGVAEAEGKLPDTLIQGFRANQLLSPTVRKLDHGILQGAVEIARATNFQLTKISARIEELRAILETMEMPIARIDQNVGLMYNEFQAHIQCTSCIIATTTRLDPSLTQPNSQLRNEGRYWNGYRKWNMRATIGRPRRIC